MELNRKLTFTSTVTVTTENASVFRQYIIPAINFSTSSLANKSSVSLAVVFLTRQLPRGNWKQASDKSTGKSSFLSLNLYFDRISRGFYYLPMFISN